MTPTVTFGLAGTELVPVPVMVNVQVFVPVSVDGLGLMVPSGGRQLVDQPPNLAPVSGAVNVTVVPIGYVATHTDPPVPPLSAQPGPQ